MTPTHPITVKNMTPIHPITVKIMTPTHPITIKSDTRNYLQIKQNQLNLKQRKHN